MTGQQLMTRWQRWGALAGLRAWQVTEVPQCRASGWDSRRPRQALTSIAEVDAAGLCAIGLSRSADIDRLTHAHVMFHIADPPIRSFRCDCPARDG